jgi:hypothetical protein
VRLAPVPETVHPDAGAGKTYEAMPDWPSVALEVTVNSPLLVLGR